MLHQIKAHQFYNDLDPYQQCVVLQKIVELKDFSRPASDFPVLFKADLILKDFSSKPSKLKYFSSLCEPWWSLSFLTIMRKPADIYSFRMSFKIGQEFYSCLPVFILLYLPDLQEYQVSFMTWKQLHVKQTSK